MGARSFDLIDWLGFLKILLLKRLKYLDLFFSNWPETQSENQTFSVVSNFPYNNDTKEALLCSELSLVLLCFLFTTKMF